MASGEGLVRTPFAVILLNKYSMLLRVGWALNVAQLGRHPRDWSDASLRRMSICNRSKRRGAIFLDLALQGANADTQDSGCPGAIKVLRF